MIHYSDFGIEARAIMLRKNITMTALAKELGITVSYVSDIFRGNRNGNKYKKKIAEILEMELIESE